PVRPDARRSARGPAHRGARPGRSDDARGGGGLGSAVPGALARPSPGHGGRQGLSRLRVVPLDETTMGAWEALFDACGCRCFCRYWHFAGGKNEWLERTFTAPERGLDEQ